MLLLTDLEIFLLMMTIGREGERKNLVALKSVNFKAKNLSWLKQTHPL